MPRLWVSKNVMPNWTPNCLGLKNSCLVTKNKLGISGSSFSRTLCPMPMALACKDVTHHIKNMGQSHQISKNMPIGPTIPSIWTFTTLKIKVNYLEKIQETWPISIRRKNVCKILWTWDKFLWVEKQNLEISTILKNIPLCLKHLELWRVRILPDSSIKQMYHHWKHQFFVPKQLFDLIWSFLRETNFAIIIKN